MYAYKIQGAKFQFGPSKSNIPKRKTEIKKYIKTKTIIKDNKIPGYLSIVNSILSKTYAEQKLKNPSNPPHWNNQNPSSILIYF